MSLRISQEAALSSTTAVRCCQDELRMVMMSPPSLHPTAAFDQAIRPLIWLTCEMVGMLHEAHIAAKVPHRNDNPHRKKRVGSAHWQLRSGRLTDRESITLSLA